MPLHSWSQLCVFLQSLVLHINLFFQGILNILKYWSLVDFYGNAVSIYIPTNSEWVHFSTSSVGKKSKLTNIIGDEWYLI